MSELEQKKTFILNFVKGSINKKEFNKLKIIEGKSYDEIIKNTTNIINKLDDEELEFHIMLIKYIKDNKISLVDPENFEEYKLECFLYNEDSLTIINKN